ncbi:MAG TPA: hypothetical protein VIW68_13460 [Candidatus Sulfotelmatobacter sp.]
MAKPKTHFELVPIEVVKKIVPEQALEKSKPAGVTAKTRVRKLKTSK